MGCGVTLPDRWRTHTITVEPYEGSGPTGRSLGDPVSATCRVEDKTELVRDSNGVEVVSSAMIFCDLDVVIPPESRVTIVGGRTSTVIRDDPFDTGGRSRLDHREVRLK